MELTDINKILKEKNLKVTPQRIAVMKVLMDNRTHPSAEVLIKLILEEHPYISVGTIYNILDMLVNNGIVEKIQTEDSIMRYDPVVKEHHHIYLDTDGEILDYFDDELTELVKNHLKKKKELREIEIEKIKINLLGRRLKTNS
jgi:Fur family peroxide stress response transcriptional regulator